jgi:outer membrane protein
MQKTILFVALWFTLPSFGQDRVVTMTLEEALQVARKQQPDLLNAERNIAYARAATREARSSYLPKITIEGDYRYNPIIQTNVLPANAFNPANDPKELVPLRFGTPWNGIAGIRLKQPVYDPAKLATLDGSKLAEELAVAEQKKIMADREEEIVKAWYSILLSRAKEEYYATDVERNRKNADVISEQVKQGRALEQDGREAVLRIRESDIELDQARVDMYGAQVYLSYVMGYDSVQLILPKEKLADMLPSMDPWQSRATEDPSNRPDVQAQLINAKIAEINMQQTRAGQLPVVNFEGYLGANNFSYRFNPFANWYGNSFLGLSVRYPVFNGGEKKSQLEQARIQYDQEKENLRKLRQQAYYEVVNSGNKASRGAKLLALQKDRIGVQEEKIAIVRSRLGEGRALAQDLLNEEARMAEIRKDYYQYAHDYLAALVELRKSSGKSPAPKPETH